MKGIPIASHLGIKEFRKHFRRTPLLTLHEIKVGKEHKLSNKVEGTPQEFEADIEDPD